jgi:hypothetical protein
MSFKFPIGLSVFGATRHPVLQGLIRAPMLGWAGLALLLPGCVIVHSSPTITGSGHLVDKVYDFVGFSRVSAGSAFQVRIARGERCAVAVTVDDNLLELVEVTQSKETLRIGLKPNVSIRQATLRADVTMPALSGLHLGGATRTTVEGFESDGPIEMDLHGASHLQGDIRTGAARVEVSGASHVDLQGSARSLKVRASGASHLNLERLDSDNAAVTASGASHVTVNVHGTLDVNASGASSVRYVGAPASVNARTSGASSVRRK